jgi:type IV secretory pathway VirB6-like protein
MRFEALLKIFFIIFIFSLICESNVLLVCGFRLTWKKQTKTSSTCQACLKLIQHLSLAIKFVKKV